MAWGQAAQSQPRDLEKDCEGLKQDRNSRVWAGVKGIKVRPNEQIQVTI